MQYNISSTYEAETINLMEYNVKYNGVSGHVNLQTCSCTCQHFDLDHMPLWLVDMQNVMLFFVLQILHCELIVSFI